jgi:hypothetical protein
MPFTVVQTKTAVSVVSGTAITCTFDNPPTEGSFLLAVVMHTGANILPDSNWGQYKLGCGNINVLYHFNKMAQAGESSTFSVTSPSSVTWAVVLREYTTDCYTDNNLISIDAGKASGASSYALSCPVDTTSPDNLGICSFAQQGGTARTVNAWSDGFTEIADLQPAGTVVAALATADQAYAAISTPTCTVTLSGVTATKPSMIVQTVATQGGPERAKSQQQAASGRW